MHKDQNGFAFVEIIAVVLVLAVVALTGYYTLSRHKATTKTATTTSHPVSQAVTPTSWLTYNSTHTPIQFSYPSDWRITHGQETGTTLENIILTGTNGFSMQFFLEKQHPLGPQNRICIALRARLDTFLNDNYTMVLEGTKDVFLQDNSAKDTITSSCGTKLNIAASQTDFTFYSSYASSASGNRSADSYMQLPEVQTAKKVFSSFIK